MVRSTSPALAGFAVHFADLQDPRRVLGRCTHSLVEVLAVAIVGVVCGADGWEDLATFAAARADWFATRLGIGGGAPSESTFRRIFTALAPRPFAAGLVSWSAALGAALAGEGVALDGKTPRGGAVGASTALHLVHAWATDRGLVLGQEACASKGGELAAMDALLDRLALAGTVVTIDAAGCHKPLAQKVLDGGGDCALTVKANQRTLHESIALRFLDASHGVLDDAICTTELTEQGHGRREARTLWAAPASSVAAAADWPGAQAVVAVRRRREVDGIASEDWRYVLSSLRPEQPERLAHVIRGHWGVENGLHWSLDVGFCEDASRIHERVAQENFATLRKFGLTLIKQVARRPGIAASRKKAGWDDRFLLQVLRGGITTD